MLTLIDVSHDISSFDVMSLCSIIKFAALKFAGSYSDIDLT